MHKHAMATQQENIEISRINRLGLKELAKKKLHHRNGRFMNPFSSTEYGNLWRLLSWKLFSKNHFESFYEDENRTSVKIDWEPVKKHQGCAVTFVKHACVMIKDLDHYLLVDPVFFDLFWYKDFTPLTFDLNNMPLTNHILITHGHYDHLDKPSLKVLGKDTHVITPLGYDSVFHDLEMNNRTQLDWFDSYKDGKREIILLPCNHWTMRNPLIGPNDSLWGSYLIKGASGYNILVAGDAAYFDRYRELGQECAIDLAIFNLGAYEPRWFMAGSHLNPAETVKAFLEVKAKYLLVVHWGSFRLGDEPVHFPPMEIKKEMEKQGIVDRLVHLDHGQTYFLKA
ncbi:MAG: hypothetical protein BA868_06805 [Desulfobacterales bacterium C00003106]|nr:MAG: hypothetical protein BA868_06805 [Desulfobacterales bacterium C00003106]